jgi:type I restriction enzyme S subunit
VEQGYPVYGANGKIGHYTEFNHEKPTVLITCRGATCGTINVCEPKSYVTGNAMALDDLDESRVSAEYLVYALRNGSLAQAISGTAQPQITRQSLTAISITLPPLAEQRRIAEVLDRVEALRAKRRAALAQLDSLTQSLFLDIFGDPATNQKGWPVRQLQEVVKEGTIVTYGIVQAGEEFRGGVPYIRTGDIVDGEIVAAGLRHTDPTIAAKFRRSRVEAGDIVMSIRATVGTTALVPPELDGANLTQGTGKISPGEKTDRLFLLNFLRTSGTQHWISLQIKGATFREITLTRLRELPVAVPPIELQREFARRVTAVEKLKTAQRASLAELDALFATLQHRAFRGEL